MTIGSFPIGSAPIGGGIRIPTLWQDFVAAMEHVAFFNDDAKAILDELFSELEKHHTVYNIEKGCHIFRIRSFEIMPPVFDVTDFSPPPRDSSQHNRFSLLGYPVLYCSLEKQTCIEEMKDRIGEHSYLISFGTLKDTRTLDLTKLIASLDSHETEEIKQFVKQICRPFKGSNEWQYSYGQAFGDYLRGHKQIEAIIYPSSKNDDGKNIAFFETARGRSKKEIGHIMQALFNLVSVEEIIPSLRPAKQPIRDF